MRHETQQNVFYTFLLCSCVIANRYKYMKEKVQKTFGGVKHFYGRRPTQDVHNKI